MSTQKTLKTKVSQEVHQTFRNKSKEIFGDTRSGYKILSKLVVKFNNGEINIKD